MSTCSIQINTLRTSTVSKWRRWEKRQDPMQIASTRANYVQAIRKLEQVYFLERRGLL